MEGTRLRQLRRRLGMTQDDVAQHLNVDQGTVSRWERGVEQPRPGNLSALRDLLLRREDRRVRDRAVAMVRNDLLPACLSDAEVHLREVSGQCVAHYRQRHGFDIRAQIGTGLRQQTEQLGVPQVPSLFRQSGLMSGDALLLRLTVNVRGAGHVTHFEPLLEDGEVIGFYSYIASRLRFAPNAETTIEGIEVLRADAMERMTEIYAGRRIDEVLAAREGRGPD